MLSCFLDSAISIYAAGADHPYRDPCAQIIAALAAADHECVTSAEVLQEILNVYVRRGEPLRAVAVISGLLGVLPTEPEAVFASDIVDAATQVFSAVLSSRDRVHVAVMRRLGIDAIISADKGFDRVPGVRRLDPLDFATWRAEVFG